MCSTHTKRYTYEKVLWRDCAGPKVANTTLSIYQSLRVRVCVCIHIHIRLNRHINVFKQYFLHTYRRVVWRRCACPQVTNTTLSITLSIYPHTPDLGTRVVISFATSRESFTLLAGRLALLLVDCLLLLHRRILFGKGCFGECALCWHFEPVKSKQMHIQRTYTHAYTQYERTCIQTREWKNRHARTDVCTHKHMHRCMCIHASRAGRRFGQTEGFLSCATYECMHTLIPTWRGGWLGSRPTKMYGERLGDGVEYHLMKPTPRRQVPFTTGRKFHEISWKWVSTPAPHLSLHV